MLPGGGNVLGERPKDAQKYAQNMCSIKLLLDQEPISNQPCTFFRIYFWLLRGQNFLGCQKYRSEIFYLFGISLKIVKYTQICANTQKTEKNPKMHKHSKICAAHTFSWGLDKGMG